MTVEEIRAALAVFPEKSQFLVDNPAGRLVVEMPAGYPDLFEQNWGSWAEAVNVFQKHGWEPTDDRRIWVRNDV